MENFWLWMIAKGHAIFASQYKYLLLDVDSVRVCPEKRMLIGYMIEFLLEKGVRYMPIYDTAEEYYDKLALRIEGVKK